MNATLPAITPDLLGKLRQAVYDVARDEVMPRFLQVGGTRKADGSLFTEADIETQRVLVKKLPLIYPCPVLGEEMTEAEQVALWENNPALWVIDPIDGTNNFINGLPYFAVSVALMQAGRPVLGVVYNPVSDEMFYAQLGHGAFVNERPLPLKVSVPDMADAIAGVEVKWLSGHLPARLAALPPYGSQRNFGASTLDWCYLAAGRLNVYVHGGQKLWDYAAGCLILSEAGGHMTSLFHEDYWEDNIWQRSVISALDAGLFAQWTRWIRANL